MARYCFCRGCGCGKSESHDVLCPTLHDVTQHEKNMWKLGKEAAFSGLKQPFYGPAYMLGWKAGDAVLMEFALMPCE